VIGGRREEGDMRQVTAGLTCPRCEGSMRRYERAGVHADQCVECREFLLDGGAWHRLINPESPFRDPAPPRAAAYDGRRGRDTRRR
jgi:Zn-finger nucleic acid-binding protein